MIAIVTATTNKRKADPCLASWRQHARSKVPRVLVQNGTRSVQYLGVVPAFAKGMELCLQRHTMELMACFHDDLVILQWEWDWRVADVFRAHPEVGLVGFAGVSQLGTTALYQEPYDAAQLSARGYRSNLVNAEQHGERSLKSARVAAVDGFALVGRKEFWQGYTYAQVQSGETRTRPAGSHWDRAAPWAYLDANGFRNHFVGSALSCLAHRAGWQVYYVPIRCRHLGGQTTEEDDGYQQWAESEIAGGDRGFYEAAHRIGYALFKDVLPLRVGT